MWIYLINFQLYVNDICFTLSENVDYYNSKTKFDNLYTSLTSSQYIKSGTTDSWFRSYTAWLTSGAPGTITAQLTGNLWPFTSRVIVVDSRY